MSTWAETWQMGAVAYGLFGGAPCTPSRFRRRTRPTPSWQLRFKAATREWITFGEHTRFARRCKGSIKDGCATPGQCAKACPEHNINNVNEPHALTSCIELIIAEPSAARRATSSASQRPS